MNNPNANPKLALDAMLDAPQLIGELTVQPMTVARMALLELVESPFTNPDKKFNISNMTESAFIMCADTNELKGFNSRNIDRLVERAYDWAENIDVGALPQVIKTVIEKLNNLYKVSPSTGSDDRGDNSKNR